MSPITAAIRKREAEVRLAIRVVIAAVVALGAARVLGLPQGYWAVITAILVIQASVGASLKAAIDRFGGTFAGAVIGAIVAIAIPHQEPWALAGAIALAIAPTALMAAINPSFKVAPVTALIVLLPTPGNTAPPYLYALDRILEILLGNVIGIAVALFILPARAHGLLIAAGARVLRLNADLMTALIEGLTGDEGRPGIAQIHARIRAALRQAETAADEASRERKSHLSDLPDPEPLVRTLYRVRHDLVMIGRAAAKPLPEAAGEILKERVLGLRDRATALLRGLGGALAEGQEAPPGDEFEAALKAFAGEIEASRPQVEDDADRLFALRFSFEQLQQDLRDLARRVDEMAGKKEAK